MKSPHEGFTPPDFTGQTKIMFVEESNPVAVLLTNRAGRRKKTKFKFASAEAALTWCRTHGVMMV